MLDPADLYRLREDLPDLTRPVLLHNLTGFVDAGGGARLAGQHLLDTLEHQVVASFDTDQLIDYRSRRPPMTFVRDHFADAQLPTLDLYLVRDLAGTAFLLLKGPEPDLQWERYAAAVRDLVTRLDVRLTVALIAIPWQAPHTRPLGLIAHATNSSLLSGGESWLDGVTVPGNAAGLVELRLGEAGLDAMGFAVQVPHYLAHVDYPAAAISLLDSVALASGLALPTTELAQAAERARVEIDEQIAASSDNTEAVRALEEQHDAMLRGSDAGDLSNLPSADEIGAEFERFLAQQDRRDDV